ncbi:hypothetical protein GCM10022398_00680 [Acetobacter lovaniensis]
MTAVTPEAQRHSTQGNDAADPAKELVDDLALAGNRIEQLRAALMRKPVKGGQAQARRVGDNHQAGLKADAEDAVKHEQAQPENGYPIPAE